MSMVAAHIGQRGPHHIEGTRLVIATADTCLHCRPPDLMPFKKRQRDQDRDFVKGMDMMSVVQSEADAIGLDPLFPRPGYIFLADKLAVDAKALTIVKKMGA